MLGTEAGTGAELPGKTSIWHLRALLGGCKRAGEAGGLQDLQEKGVQKAILLKKVEHDIRRWKDNLFI